MKKADAEKQIFRIWLNWSEAQDKYGTHFGSIFYGWLRKNEDELLSFRCTRDKYQVINSWVMQWQREHPKYLS